MVKIVKEKNKVGKGTRTLREPEGYDLNTVVDKGLIKVTVEKDL